MTARFIPAHPPRTERQAPFWAGFFGERARNAVSGWSHGAFETWHTRRRLLRIVVHFPRHPDAIERLLLTNAANYQKPRIIKKLLMPMLGSGLLTADGALWRSQRKVVAPSFAPGAVATLAGAMAEAARRRMRTWPREGRIDIAAEATGTTMRIIADTLFSGDPRLTTPEASRHISAALQAAAAARLTAILGIPPLGLTRSIREGKRGRRYLRAALTSIVEERGGEGGDDFLGGMIRDLHGRFPAEEANALAIDNAATFYLAGHETTANALAWAVYLLAGAPEVQERARAEALAAVDGDPATLADRLPYLRQVLDETLRLYPPAPRFDREAVAADVLHGEAIGAGDIVSIWPWVIHRHRQLWDDADAFDPDRFAPGADAGRHRFQYIPFGGGPRTCVGARFAIVEALVILAHWLAARRFAPAEGHVVAPVGTVTLRPGGGLPIDIVEV